MNEEKIQEYVSGSLPKAEAEAVAAIIAADPDLTRLAEQYRIIYKGLRLQRISELENELTNSANGSTHNPGKKSFRKWIWGIGIAAVLLAAFGVFQQINYYASASIAERYFQLPPDPRLAGQETEMAQYSRSIDDFYAGNHLAAIAGFSGLQSSNDYGVLARFYLPHAQFLAGNLTEADRAFESALRLTDLSETDLELLRWNTMITDLAQGEDIDEQLAQGWGSGFPADQLREELNAVWR
ncbi:hypothetical protein CEQ90_05675 [Lewinellaceae bacterium SD302]|nr:hypothetical protein CEQ90_05675 [Lewinellaceae bacterium SD302]